MLVLHSASLTHSWFAVNLDWWCQMAGRHAVLEASSSVVSDNVFLDDTPTLVLPAGSTPIPVRSERSHRSELTSRMDMSSSSSSVTFRRYVITESAKSALSDDIQPLRFTRSISNIDYPSSVHLTRHRNRTVSTGLFRYKLLQSGWVYCILHSAFPAQLHIPGIFVIYYSTARYMYLLQQFSFFIILLRHTRQATA